MSSDLQSKLFHFEIQPPERIWNGVQAALDQDAVSDFPQRLRQYEKLPPASIWSRVREHLPSREGVEIPVLKFHQRYSRPLKYSGVAACFIILAMISSLFISKKSESELPASQALTRVSQPANVTAETPSQVSQPQPVSYTGQNRHVSMSLPQRISLQLQTKQENTMALLDHLAPKFAERRAITFNHPSDNYMVYSDDEGNAVRLPKRLYDAIACPQENSGCRERLKKIQQKMAASALTSDLAGMLEMLNNLQENQ